MKKLSSQMGIKVMLILLALSAVGCLALAVYGAATENVRTAVIFEVSCLWFVVIYLVVDNLSIRPTDEELDEVVRKAYKVGKGYNND